jgi:hypothetical protein
VKEILAMVTPRLTDSESISAPAVLSLTDKLQALQVLKDPRISLFSCCDLGGTDGADDWMFKLAGQADKYEPIGLHVYRSNRGTRRVGTLFFSLDYAGSRISEWGNIDCLQACADRVLLSTAYWGCPELAADIEILMLRPGCCRLGVRLQNNSDVPVPAMMHCTFQAADLTVADIAQPTFVNQSKDGAVIVNIQSGLAQAEIPPGQTVEFTVFIAAAQETGKAENILRQAQELDLAEFRRKQEQLRQPAEGIERFTNPDDQKFAREVYNVMRGNLIQRDDTFFSAPNRVVHKGQWLWDTCFHAFAWNIFSPRRTEILLENLFAYQEADSGFIPISVTQTSGVTNYATQPPLIAFAVDKLVKSADVRKRLYPKLTAFYKWFQSNRQLSNGLYRWNTAGESGMDNSPRFDDDPSKPTQAAYLNFCVRVMNQSVAHIDISCMMALFAESMANIAESLGIPDDARQWRAQYEQLQLGINDFLFDPRDGFYYDRDIDGTWRRIKTVASFWPLIAGVCSKAQASSVTAHLMNPSEFFTPMPIPSVAIDEPSFCFNYWRGPIWINTCFATVLGLKRYGLLDEARQIGQRVVDGVRKELLRTGQLWEIYDPFGEAAYGMTKKYSGPRQNAICFAGWTANALNIILEVLQPE